MTATISDSSSRAHGRVPVVSPASPGEKTQELADYQPYVDRLGDVVRPIRIPAKIGPASLTAAQDGPRVVRRPGSAVHRLPGGAPARKTGVRVQRTAFWLLAYVFFAVMLGPTLPSPLYVLYQAEWHFSAGILTPGCSTCAWTYCGGARVHGNGPPCSAGAERAL